MKKITYLFGAGASAKAVPVVKELPDKLDKFLERLRSDRIFSFSENDSILIGETSVLKQKIKARLHLQLESLIKEIKNHASIDTYAKKLYLQPNSGNRLLHLKTTLACFFAMLQTLDNYDRRYDTFFASIITKTNEIPNHLRILSWNYDSQFEIAYTHYTSLEDIASIQTKLSISPNNLQLHGLSSIEIDTTKFGIFKLNGTASVFNPQEGKIHPMVGIPEKEITKETVDRILFLYALLQDYSQYNNLLMNFAWEDHIITKQVIEKAIESTKDTSVLVCIGYSFPFFNREIDRKIIGGMTNLETVYFQALKDDIDENMERFKAIGKDVKTVAVRDIHQFFLPPEL
jgi:hypothetical protein